MAAEGARDGWRAVGVGGLEGAELDPLEALGTKDMQALQHPGAFVVLVVLLVADGTLYIHGFPRGGAGARCCSSWVPRIGSWANFPCHEWMAWELSDIKMQLVVEYLTEDGKICEEKNNFKSTSLDRENSRDFCKCHVLFSCCFVSSKFYEQIPDPMSHSIRPLNHSSTSNPPPPQLLTMTWSPWSVC